MPVPCPTRRVTGRPLRAASRALLAVVLAMPISPTIRQQQPAAWLRAAARMPTSMARWASARLMASSRAKLAVPGRTLSWTTPSPSTVPFTPTSTTSSRAPIWRAKTLMAAPPAAKLATICAVTSWGKADTPSSATPWSAAKTITPGGLTAGAALPLRQASWMTSDSRRPRLPGGLVRLSRRVCTTGARASSTGTMAARVSASMSVS